MAQAIKPAVPTVWRNVLAIVALGKAAIAGVGLGIAALGVVDVTTALSIKQHIHDITQNHALEVFSASGGAIGFVWRLVSGVLR